MDDHSENFDVEDKCSVCLGKFVEPTQTNNCGHIFCFLCIRQWLACCLSNICPLCKEPIVSIVQKTCPKASASWTISDLRKILELEACWSRCNKTPLKSEKEIINKRIADLRDYLDSLQTVIEVPAKQVEFAVAISELTALRTVVKQINDGTILRRDVVTNPFFRRLIYKMDVTWYQVEEEANPDKIIHVFGKSMGKDKQDRLLQFIRNEVDVLEMNTKGNLAKNILQIYSEFPSNSSEIKKRLLSLGFTERILRSFQMEFVEFANSQLNLNDYWTICGYKLSNDEMRNGDFSVGGLSDEAEIPLIQIDEDDDEADNLSESYEEVSSESETESALYMRRSCLLPVPRKKLNSQLVEPSDLSSIPAGSHTGADSQDSEATSVLSLFGESSNSSTIRSTSLKRKKISSDSNAKRERPDVIHDVE